MPPLTRSEQPLVWLHGWASHPRVWRPLHAALPGLRHELWSYDRHVTGTPLAITAPLSPDTVLIGWSLGGMLALAAAAQTPIAALVLIGTSLRFFDPAGHHGWPPAVLRRMQRRMLSQPNEVLESFIDTLFASAEAGREYRREVLADAPIQGTDFTNEQLAAGLETLAALDLRDWARKVRCPVLWLHGAHDAVCPAAGFRHWQASLAGCPNHTFIELTEAGHLPHWTHPSLVAHHLHAFLS